MDLAFHILDISAYVVGIGAVATILVIVVRKIRMVSSIDTDSIPRLQQEKKRKEIASQRLLRKFERAGGAFGRFAMPVFSSIGQSVQKTVKRLTRFERKIALQKAEDTVRLVPEVADKKIQQLQERADEALADEEFKKAEDAYIEMISIDPKSVDAYKQLGDLYMLTKDYKTACETFQYIITLEEKKMGTRVASGENVPTGSAIAGHHADLAQSYMGLERWDKALQSLKESLLLEPNNPKYLDHLVHINIQLKRKEDAVEALRRLQEVNPENQKIAELEEEIQAIA